MNKRHLIYCLIIGLLGLGTGCKKFLSEKTNSAFTVPDQLSDLQALLDYAPTMIENDLSAGEICSDNYYLADNTWSGLSSAYMRRLYTWEKSGVFAPEFNDWANGYKTVYVANEVLTDLKGIPKTDQETTWNNLYGQAQFYRAKSFLQMVSIWGAAYDGSTANGNLGIPLRLNVNFNEPSIRASLAESYDQIIKDMKTAVRFLPKTAGSYRPSKAGAYGYLARVYLNMRNYETANLYADSCLQVKNELLDYNSLNGAVAYPFAKGNVEVVFDGFAGAPTPLSPTRAKIVADLYGQYAGNDLRKVAYFKKNTDLSYAFKGGYEGSSALFTGIATDEMYLIKAECLARGGVIVNALQVLNALLVKRYKTGTFTPLTGNNKDDVLALVLAERRKELLMRGLRWMDLKRLNREGANILINRNLNGKIYQLLPNDAAYALPIPDDVINLSGMQQNP